MSDLESNSKRLNSSFQDYYKISQFDIGSFDFVGTIFHGYSITHLDALCHFFKNKDEMYNGHSTTNLDETGAKMLGIENFASQGIVGRGILLDMPLIKNEPLPSGTNFYPEDLTEAEIECNVKVSTGDILFVRTGAGIKANG